jgi:putative sigma-54 modulation protein
MKLQIHSIHFDADQKLLDYIQKKVDKLHKFFDRITDGEVFLKLEKGDKVDNKVVEIKVNVPGSSLFVKAQSKSFEAAADEAADALEIQIKKFKEKSITTHTV